MPEVQILRPLGSDGFVPLSFVTYPLIVGDSRWSQIWLGGIGRPDNTVATCVLKFFQESKFPSGGEGGSTGEQLASNEADAFDAMANLQGTLSYCDTSRMKKEKH
jgi:hypothetical protein